MLSSNLLTVMIVTDIVSQYGLSSDAEGPPSSFAVGSTMEVSVR